jgi:hypothetical protein
MDGGRGRFSPDTLRGMGAPGVIVEVVGNASALGVAWSGGVGVTDEGVGIWDLNGDFETRLVLLSFLNVDELRRAI